MSMAFSLTPDESIAEVAEIHRGLAKPAALLSPLGGKLSFSLTPPIAMAIQTSSIEERLHRLERRSEAEDALLRFALGQDKKDARLLTSAFTVEAELDFTQPARRFGVSIEVFRGRDTIVSNIVASTVRVRTHHMVTNQRVELNGNVAHGTALVEAQHAVDDSHLLLKNLYSYQLRSTSGIWQLHRVLIETMWHDGDARLLFPS